MRVGTLTARDVSGWLPHRGWALLTCTPTAGLRRTPRGPARVWGTARRHRAGTRRALPVFLSSHAQHVGFRRGQKGVAALCHAHPGARGEGAALQSLWVREGNLSQKPPAGSPPNPAGWGLPAGSGPAAGEAKEAPRVRDFGSERGSPRQEEVRTPCGGGGGQALGVCSELWGSERRAPRGRRVA